MAIKSASEIMEQLKTKLGEDTSDETISFVEDVNDTLTDYENKTKNSTDWEQKFKDNDKMWREKYRDRFFNSESDDSEFDDKPSEDSGKIRNFDDLFKEG